MSNDLFTFRNYVVPRLMRWLETHHPAGLDAMGPGLMELAIDMYERDDLHAKIPASLRALYHWRNGAYPDRDGRIFGRRELIGLGPAVRWPRDPAWHECLLPVLRDGDNFMFWDRTSGALVERDQVIAPNVDEYIVAYIESLEHGMWKLTEDGLDDGGKFTEMLATRFPGYPKPWQAPAVKPKPPPPKPAPVKQYAATIRFAVGDRVEHAKFGTGTVQSVEATKVVIEFESGKRTLVHARK